MDHLKIEKKWQEYWQNHGTNRFDTQKRENKYYVLEMFSYPSGYNLHVGHWYNFAPSDTFARFKKMQGFNVFQPMGFDAFGLPAENHAIKTGVHPLDNTMQNITVMERQLKDMGAMYDWDAKVITCDPEYYRWSQWIFLQLYKNKLAYQKHAPVNWCTSCNTAIANEQVEDGRCERCKSEVIRKNQVQWFFKITDYAEELLQKLDSLDWPEKTKAMQSNWIGKSSGSEITFKLKDFEEQITVFTTRADTLLGVSYIVLAPEHPLVDIITLEKQRQAVKEYQYLASKTSDVDRVSDKGGKTGVFTGAYCIHPLTGASVPVWIADYCLSTYGTGAVMGVAAHDTRDYAFAKKYDLPILKVIKPIDSEKSSSSNNLKNNNPAELNYFDDSNPYTEYGILTNSGKYNGLSSEDAKKCITLDLQKKQAGTLKTTYRLRDWSVSRQRYWGCPIPIIHCDICGAVPVPDKDLPVKLPYDVNFTPDGQSPLSKNKAYSETVCPHCGKPAKRDCDTLDTFICSSWYFLRYADNKNPTMAFNKDIINTMLPVDKYIGGPEHACMHLLYSRFIVKALRDMGLLNFDEPFSSLVHQGLILGPDGEKMSKSNGNVVNPDDYTSVYGSDIFRMYLMFGFSYMDGGPWNDSGIKAMSKFFDRTERILDIALESKIKSEGDTNELLYALNYAIKSVAADLEVFSFNTAIARLMELVNTMYKYIENGAGGLAFYDTGKSLVKLIAPFAPHFAEEMHERYGAKTSVFSEKFPICDQTKLVKNRIEIAVQINSKIRSRILIDPEWDDTQIVSAALSDEKVNEFIGGGIIKKTITVKNKLINFIM